MRGLRRAVERGSSARTVVRSEVSADIFSAREGWEMKLPQVPTTQDCIDWLRSLIDRPPNDEYPTWREAELCAREIESLRQKLRACQEFSARTQENALVELRAADREIQSLRSMEK